VNVLILKIGRILLYNNNIQPTRCKAGSFSDVVSPAADARRYVRLLLQSMHSIFISYPDPEKDIVGSLRECLADLGVQAWVYSHDKTIAKDTWGEIEEKILSCRMVVYVVSKHSVSAQGQHRELDTAIELIGKTRPDLLTVPVLVGDISFSDIPDAIRHINGLYLDTFSKKTTALGIAKLLNPNIAEENWEWRYPLPSQWLQVCNLDQWTEEFFDLGEYVYFRRLSPMGLFECYSPKLKGLFWFYSKNLRPAPFVDEDRAYEREQVPYEYRVGTMLMRELERKP